MFHRGNDHIGVLDTELIGLVTGGQGKGISPLNQADYLVLDFVQFRILARIVGDGHDIDVVQGAEVVEMNKMVVDILSAHDQIPEKGSPPGNLGTKGHIKGTDRSHLVNAKADAAETARDITGVPRIFSQEKGLESAGHGAAAPGVLDLSVFDFYFDLEVSLYSRHWIDGDSLSHGSALLCYVFSFLGIKPAAFLARILSVIGPMA